MARFQVLISRFWALLRKSRIEKELDEELRLHLDMLIEENLQRGMPPEDARYAALRSFGGVEQVKEAYRQRRGLVMLETLVQDTKQGFRLVLRNPTFSATVIVVVALGIGAACVIFSFAEAAVLHALPYRNPSGLVSVSMTDLKASGEGGGVSIPVFLNWRENGKKIGQFEVTKQLFQTLVGGNEPVQVVGDQVSEGAFEVLGFKPIIGRGFLPSDYKRGSEAVVILSYSSWQELFNGRNDVIGRSVSLDGVQHTVIGVMPAPFMVPESGDLERSYWTPLVFTPKQMADVGDRSLDVWGRLNPGTSAGQAEAALAVLAKHVSRNSTSPWSSKWRLEAVPLVTKVVDDWRSVLILLFGAVACLLAITCANVANLLLARASNRATEIAVRVAVGAGRWRLMCQLLTESVIMGCLGGICGILLAHWGNRVIFQLLPVKLQAPNFRQMGIDPLVLTGTLVISILVGVLFGLAPALKATKLDLVESLKEGNASFSSNRGRMTTQDLFVVSEVAISLVLLVGAGLLARSFLKLEHVQLGFQPSQVLTMRVLLPQYEYAKKEQQIAAYHELLERIRSLPGVQKSGFVTPLPLDRISATVEFPAQPGMASPHGADVLFFGS
ncbi:MAG: ABC transporter permease, partial [Terriglobia bacterium]